MIIPNKITSLEESVLGKVTNILECIFEEEKSITELYMNIGNKFEDINEFIWAIDILYVLEAIELTYDKKVIKYVKGN
ncbi:ABC-three component system middle component 7 [Clostridium saccharoperbutylacetonicum]|uniref:ABC-three component system middle component 7 n=1 Tax=Clostridium saccharoperbutylacetonicum TaxID=36745 RepID=UPI000983DF58|nr:ABC-three component system middle component 7 [Clostridium saccharoperbutylacetonicum]AQR93406.1 hypothetical protein CLSAP_07040 [Clostridium saccharoperbutylacetonicum]NSB29103.1 hypothetical protein [Clostridium saccharoperbutylacetonicum]